MQEEVGTERKQTTRPFPQALGELLRFQQQDPLGTVNLRTFFAQIPEYSYDALRKMVRGKLPLQPQAIEAMAAVLGVLPDYFVEYRAWQVREGLKRHPETADQVYEMLMASFALLDERKGLKETRAAQTPGRLRGRRGLDEAPDPA
jgi:hypothetical protein